MIKKHALECHNHNHSLKTALSQADIANKFITLLFLRRGLKEIEGKANYVS